MAVQVIHSEYDGQLVTYIDPLRLEHTGVVVGASPDGKWFYVQSDNPTAPAADWHFRIAARLLPQFLTN